MELTQQSIDAFTKILNNPSEYNLLFRPLPQSFEDCTEATPKHILFEQYQTEVGGNLPKVIFYIIMDMTYPTKIAKSASGELGYLLKFKPI